MDSVTKAVLGIDAAWTAKHPSGVAVAVQRSGRWHLAALAASYGEFLAVAGSAVHTQAFHLAQADALLEAAERVAGIPIDLVAVDMPLARAKITGRRAADNRVSQLYGRRKCGTHSPTAARPGAISDAFRSGFEHAGYGLCTQEIVGPGLIEVYPHPALLELTGSDERLPYKATKTAVYWKHASSADRRARLLDQWASIVAALDGEIAGASAALPPPSPTVRGAALKAYEDKIDAVVCAWVATRALAGMAQPHGDADAAIWIPQSRLGVVPA